MKSFVLSFVAILLAIASASITTHDYTKTGQAAWAGVCGSVRFACVMSRELSKVQLTSLKKDSWLLTTRSQSTLSMELSQWANLTSHLMNPFSRYIHKLTLGWFCWWKHWIHQCIRCYRSIQNRSIPFPFSKWTSHPGIRVWLRNAYCPCKCWFVQISSSCLHVLLRAQCQQLLPW